MATKAKTPALLKKKAAPKAPAAPNGRPKKPEAERMTTVSFKAKRAQHAEFVNAGGGTWVRDLLDKRLKSK